MKSRVILESPFSWIAYPFRLNYDPSLVQSLLAKQTFNMKAHICFDFFFQ